MSDPDCLHENTRLEGNHPSNLRKVCDDCDKALDEEGPGDDDWIQSSLERAAGVGEPNRDYYDGGRLRRG